MKMRHILLLVVVLGFFSYPAFASGGACGGTLPEHFVLREAHDRFLFKDQTTSYKFSGNGNPVEFLNVTGNINAGWTSALVEVLGDTPSFIENPAPGPVYSYINIWAAPPKDIKEAR